MPNTSDERIRTRDRVTSVAPMQEQHKIRKKVCRSKRIGRKLSSSDRTRPLDLVATSPPSTPQTAFDRFQSPCNMRYDDGANPDAREKAMQMATSDNKMADTDEKIFIGKGEQPAWLTLALANHHGLVTGATGTGKTVSLQVMAEGFARAGVPVFAADIKGDLSGISEVGEPKDFILKRAGEMGLTFQPDQFSTVFWDVFGEQGHPVRATVTEMGPLLLSRMLDLNDVQEGVMNVAFRVADENGLLLLDMKDIRALLDAIVPDPGKKGDDDPLAPIRKAAQGFGNVTKATDGTIQRQLLVLENQGGTKFFGEPALTLKDFMRTDRDGRGMVNILVADKLMQSPRLYATFLLWMLSELFEELPEAGDPPKPKLVFFFDEEMG